MPENKIYSIFLTSQKNENFDTQQSIKKLQASTKKDIPELKELISGRKPLMTNISQDKAEEIKYKIENKIGIVCKIKKIENNKNWFYKSSNGEMVPATFEEMVEMVKNGKINFNSKIFDIQGKYKIAKETKLYDYFPDEKIYTENKIKGGNNKKSNLSSKIKPKSKKNKIFMTFAVVFVILVGLSILGSTDTSENVKTKPNVKNDKINTFDKKIKAVTEKVKTYPHFLNITPDKNLFEIIKILQNFKGDSEYTMFLDLPVRNFDDFGNYDCDIPRKIRTEKYNIKNLKSKEELEQLIGSVPSHYIKKYPFKSRIYPGYYYLNRGERKPATTEILITVSPIYIEGMEFEMELSGTTFGFNQIKPLDDLLVTKYKGLNLHSCQLKKEVDNTILGFTYNYIRFSISDPDTVNMVSYNKMVNKMKEKYKNFRISLNEHTTYFSVSGENSPGSYIVLSNPDNPKLIYNPPLWYLKKMQKLWDEKKSNIVYEENQNKSKDVSL